MKHFNANYISRFIYFDKTKTKQKIKLKYCKKNTLACYINIKLEFHEITIKSFILNSTYL